MNYIEKLNKLRDESRLRKINIFQFKEKYQKFTANLKEKGVVLTEKEKAILKFCEMCYEYYVDGKATRIPELDKLVALGHMRATLYRIKILGFSPASKKTMADITKNVDRVMNSDRQDIAYVFHAALKEYAPPEPIFKDLKFKLKDRFAGELLIDEAGFYLGSTWLETLYFSDSELQDLLETLNRISVNREYFVTETVLENIRIGDQFRIVVFKENANELVLDFYFKNLRIHTIKLRTFLGENRRRHIRNSDLAELQKIKDSIAALLIQDHSQPFFAEFVDELDDRPEKVDIQQRSSYITHEDLATVGQSDSTL